jgi:hypothetical protein
VTVGLVQEPSRSRAWAVGESGSAAYRGEGETGIGQHVHALVGKLEVADVAVVEGLGAGPVVADGVVAPAAPEVLAAGGQFADEVVEVFVVGVAAGFGVQDGDAGVGGQVPVGIEVVGGVEVEEGEPDVVRYWLPRGLVNGWRAWSGRGGCPRGGPFGRCE